MFVGLGFVLAVLLVDVLCVDVGVVCLLFCVLLGLCVWVGFFTWVWGLGGWVWFGLFALGGGFVGYWLHVYGCCCAWWLVAMTLFDCVVLLPGIVCFVLFCFVVAAFVLFIVLGLDVSLFWWFEWVWYFIC